MYLIENDEKHSSMFVKLFNKYVEIEKINKKIIVKEPKDTYQEDESNKVMFSQYFCDYVYTEKDFDGYVITNNIPEFWQSYMELLIEKEIDKLNEKNIENYLSEMKKTTTYKEIALDKEIRMLKHKNTLEELKEEI